MTAETVWERVDLPVLRFVVDLDYSLRWRFDRAEPTEELPELKGEELDAALRRLEEHGLIAAGGRARRPATSAGGACGRHPTGGGRSGSGRRPPRPTWAALVHILRALAEDAGDEQAKPLRRAAGSVGKLAGNVVFDVAKAELGRAGGGIAT